MTKYALMILVPGASPETYSQKVQTEDSLDWYVGVNYLTQALALMEQLREEDFTSVNLCGDFDDAALHQLQRVGKDQIQVRAARYLPEEQEHLGALTSASEYGFISYFPALEQRKELELQSDACHTRIMLVPDLEQACQAAEILVDAGVDLIELCGWFDEEKTRAVSSAIPGNVPVGSCGIA